MNECLSLAEYPPRFLPGGCEASWSSIIETSLSRAVDQADAGVIVTDTNGIIQYANYATTKMTGYSIAELVGHSTRILKSGEQDPSFYDELWATIKSGLIWRGELLNRRRNGSLYTEKMTISPVTDAFGRTISFIAVKEDITAYRAAEGSRRFLASIVESSTDAIVASSLDGLVTSWNRAARLLYEYKKEEIVGKPVALLVAPDELPRLHDYSSRIHRGEQIPHFEGVGITKSGNRIDISLSLTATRDHKGNETGHAAIIRDITEKKRVEQALRGSETRYRRLFEQNLAGALRTTPDGRILECNSALARALGYEKPEELLSKAMPDLYCDAEDRDLLVARLLSEGSLSNSEILCRKKDGGSVWLLLNLNLFDGGHEEGAVIEGTAIDISERKQFEQDLVEAGGRAEAGNRVKTEFLTNMSHELRTPLNGIISMLDLLSEHRLDQEEQEYLALAKVSAESLLASVQQILDITSLDNSQIELQSRTFNIAAEVRSALETLVPNAEARTIELNWRIDSRIPRTVVGDPLRLRQIFANLVGNAIKFTERGNVSVVLTRVRQSDDDAEIECSIVDTGIGIDQDKLQTIFEVFGQADTSLRRRFGGLGLGLSISARLIKMMGGKIRIESTVGSGTKLHFTVRLRLPADGLRTSVERRPAIPLSIPRNWATFQRHLEGHSTQVKITRDMHPASVVTGRIWSASEGFVRAVSDTPLDTGETVQLAFDERHHVHSEVVFCQQWPNAFNLGFQLLHEGRSRREPRFPIEAKGVLTVLGDAGPRQAGVEIIDVSGSGLGIICSEWVVPGACVEIKADAGIILGEVKYCEVVNEGRHRCGVKMYQLVEQDAGSKQVSRPALLKWLRRKQDT